MNRRCSLAGVPLMSRVHSHKYLFVLLLVAGLAGSSAVAQDPKPAEKSTDKPASASQDPAGQDVDPLKRPLEGKKKKQQMKDYTKEIKGPYKKWLDEDVAWSISLRAFRDGSRIEGGFTSCSVRRTRLSRIPRAELTSDPWKKAGARRPRSHSKPGAIATWKESDRNSSLNSSTPACAATIT